VLSPRATRLRPVSNCIPSSPSTYPPSPIHNFLPMYSSRDVDGDILQSLSPPETIPPDITLHVDQSYRHQSASWSANVSSNSTTTHQIHNDSTISVPHRRAKPRRLPGMRFFASIAGKIPFFRCSPRLTSEDHVTASAQPFRRELSPADSPSSPILGTTSHD